MTPIGLALIVFGSTFGAALVGMRLRSVLPEHQLGAESKELIHLCMGLIATLTALILGLITASAKNTYDEQAAAIKSEAANVLSLDRILASFGPEAEPVREGLRRALARAIDVVWQSAGDPGRPEVRNLTTTSDQIERASQINS
jgi:hypothetical protein